MNELSSPAGIASPIPDQPNAAVPAGKSKEVTLSQLVADFYDEAEPSLRARTLECLLKPVSPLGLVVVATGAFGTFLHRKCWGSLSVSIDDAMHFTWDQIFELARFVEQVQPEAFQQVACLMADNPVCLKTLTGSLLLTAVRLWIPSRSSGDHL